MMPKSGNTVTLVTGGSRSGKSSHALKLAEPFEKKGFIATAEALDGEMKERIENHQRERAEAFTTLEEPLQVARMIRDKGGDFDVLILDCLTVWLGNLQYHLDKEVEQEGLIREFLESLQSPPCHIILVTNEVGMGIVPESELSRKFRDAAGKLNQQVASIADQVVLVVSGIPVIIK
jgi:adenosylcobinamide kinase / adenosylcobinamide-phosphate guanylyltransferase